MAVDMVVVKLLAMKDGSCYAVELPAGRVAGAKGLIVRYLDPFKKVGQPELVYKANERLDALWVSPSGALHAVGKRYHTNKSGKWTSSPIGKQSCYGIWGTDDDHLWVSSTFPATVFRGDGKRWEATALGEDSFAYGVDGTSGTDVYVAGDDGVAHYDGKSWKRSLESALSVRCLSKDRVLVTTVRGAYQGSKTSFKPIVKSVGELFEAVPFAKALYFTTGGSLLRFDGKRNEVVQEATGNFGLTAMDGAGDRLWAEDGNELLCFDGKTWRRVPCFGRSVKIVKKPKPKKADGTPIDRGEERYFEFADGASSKFWSIRRARQTLYVRFGRINSEGQQQAKPFESQAAADAAREKLIAEKTRKGYREVTR